MKEILITEGEEGLRLDKLLLKYLNNASSGFIYKMLRKKNITLNGKKAKGDERLNPGDMVRLYLSDDTIAGFRSEKETVRLPHMDLDIIYEDKDILMVNKPAGLLSQKAKADDISINEYLKSYCAEKYGEDPLFTPSVCNRLDRNTSGIITFGKTLEGSRELSKVFKERTIHKYYLALVKGDIREPKRISDFLIKDEKTNTVKIYKDKKAGAVPIETEYRPMASDGTYTLLEIKLITGKSHQIRAHLWAEGYPLVGDPKYFKKGDRDKLFSKHQLLHARRVVFPEGLGGCFEAVSGKEMVAGLPDYFEEIITKLYPDITI